jgi:hypothetical protein
VIADQIKAQRERYYSRYFFDSSPTRYKLEMAKEKKADILIIGRSTVLDFRSEMFHPFENRFYNMGFAINTVSDLQSVVNLIRNKEIYQPKIMIIGFDAPIIKTGIFDHVNRIDEPHEDEVYNLKLHFLAYQLILRQLYLSVDSNLSPNINLGFGYLGDCGMGFRRDGSRFDAVAIQKSLAHPGYHDDGSLEDLLRTKGYPFDYPYKINDHLFNDFISCLTQLKKLGIKPIIFFPPLSGDFYSFMQKEQSFRIFLNNYLSLQNTLTKMGYDIINFKTPKNLGVNDSYMLDGIHPGELLSAKLWLNFLKTKPQSGILKGIDTTYVKKLITSNNAIPLSLMTDTLLFNKTRANTH